MHLFRNTSSQNNQNRGKSVGGKFSATGLRFFEPKFIEQLNNPTVTKTKTDNRKTDIPKVITLKQNMSPKQSKLPLVIKKQQIYPKIRGLHNIGNTCYLNSILQCLLHLQKLIEVFYNNNYKIGVDNNTPIGNAFYEVVKQLIESTSISPINPSTLKSSIGKKKSRFLGNSQQDSQQFLTAFLQTINQELSRIKTKPIYKELDNDPTKKSIRQLSQEWWSYYLQRDNSIICDLFTGQLLSTVSCKRCQNKSVTFDNIWGISLNVIKNKSISQLLTNYFKTENQIEDYNCSKCKKLRNCIRTFQLFRLPQILVIQLKRFQYGKFSKEKIKDFVVIEKELNMKELLNSEAPRQEVNYKLIGNVHHFGQTDYGHYFANIYDKNNKKWYEMNDSKATQLTSIQQVSRSVYLLFYERNY